MAEQASQQLSDYLKIRLSPDGMKAFVDFFTPPPQEVDFQLTVLDLKRLLDDKGICYGLLSDIQFEHVIDSWLGTMLDVIVAKGTEPTSSIPESIEYTFNLKPSLHLLERDDGTVDYRELGLMQNAVVGQLLAFKKPAVLGAPGIDVRNQPVAPLTPPPVPMPAGSGTTISDDGMKLYAATDGQLVFGTDSKVTVSTVYYVKEDVNFSTGNIDFRGSVVVRGNVSSGFTVKADHHIEIYGIVEAANIICGGDLVIRGGVQGSARTHLEAGGTIRAMYLQNAVVQAGGDLSVSDSIMHSTVSARTVRITGKRGLLLGGKTTVTDGLFARVLGSHLSVVTPIILGHFPSPQEHIMELDKQCVSLQEQIIAVEESVRRMNVFRDGTKPLTGEQKRAQERANATVIELQEKVQNLQSQQAPWVEMLAGDAPYVYIGTVAYAGVMIHASVADFHIEELTRACKYVLHEQGFERVSL